MQCGMSTTAHTGCNIHNDAALGVGLQSEEETIIGGLANDDTGQGGMVDVPIPGNFQSARGRSHQR